MTPKEKAIELRNKFWHTCNCSIAGTSTIFEQIAKECALIAVEEMLNTCDTLIDGKRFVFQKLYLDELKKEIEKL